MKLTVKHSDLLRIVKTVALVRPTRSTLPALECVWFDFEDGLLTARATNLRTFSESRCEASCDGPSAFGVNANKLEGWLSLNPSETVTIMVDKTAHFESGRGRTTLSVSTEPPTWLSVSAPLFVIHSKDLDAAMRKVVHAAKDKEDDRPQMCSVILDFDGDKLNVLSLDGSCFGKCVLSAKGSGVHLIPTFSVTPLVQMLAAVNGDIAIASAENGMKFSCDEWTLSTLVYHGGIMPWRKIEELSQGLSKIIVKRADLLAAVKNAMPFGVAGFTRLEIEGREGVIRVHSGMTDSTDMELDGKFADKFGIAVDGRRLLNLLSVLSGDDIEIELLDHTCPIAIREGNFIGAIQPLRNP